MTLTLSPLWRACLQLISSGRCALCTGCAEDPAPFCGACQERLALPIGGLQGDEPLLWCAVAPYAGALRALLLRQRPRPDRAVLMALSQQLQACCSQVLHQAVLVPIPSWKRAANPLPQLLAASLVQHSHAGATLLPDLLQRSRPTLGQHHLNRSLRWSNQLGSFRCTARNLGPDSLAACRRRRPLWLVDDILTTGATALAAADALQREGFAVQGLLCLARTPPAAPR